MNFSSLKTAFVAALLALVTRAIYAGDPTTSEVGYITTDVHLAGGDNRSTNFTTGLTIVDSYGFTPNTDGGGNSVREHGGRGSLASSTIDIGANTSTIYDNFAIDGIPVSKLSGDMNDARGVGTDILTGTKDRAPTALKRRSFGLLGLAGAGMAYAAYRRRRVGAIWSLMK